MKLFVNWHCIDMFGIPTRQRGELFVHVSSRWSGHEASLLLLVPTPSVFAYHPSFALFAERRSLLFYIAVAEHGAYSLLSLFSSALLG